MNSRFNLIIPAYYCDKSNQERMECTLSLKISKDSCILLFISSQFQLNPFQIQLNKYNKMHTKIGKCKFMSDNHSFSLLFIESQSHQNRFLYSLADAGIIIPIDLKHYAVMSSPVNIPNGRFLNIEMSVTLTVHNLFRNRYLNLSLNINNDILQEFANYSAAFFSNILNAKVKSWIKSDKTHSPLPEGFNIDNAIGWLQSKSTPKSNNYSQAHDKIKDANDDMKRLIKVINADSPRHRSNDPKWTNLMSKTCTEILCALVADGHQYLQGEFDICAKVALILGDSGTSEMIFNGTRYICEFVPLKDRASAAIIQDISNSILDIYKKVCPEIHKFFEIRGWNNFMMLGNNIPHLFTRCFNEIWKIWYWLSKTEKIEIAFSCFCASILIMMLPEIAKHKTVKLDFVLEYWDDAITKIDVNQVLNLSNYLYQNYTTE